MCSQQREKCLLTATGIHKIENGGFCALLCGSDTLSKTSFRCSNGLHKASIYELGEEVLVRYRPNRRGKFPPKRRQILKGKIIDRNRKIGMYKIDIHPPGADTNIEKWVSVENITDISEKIANQKRQQKEKKRKLKRLRKELYIPKTEADHYEVFTDLGFTISYNPPGNGNCQFNAMCYFASSDWYPQITF